MHKFKHKCRFVGWIAIIFYYFKAEQHINHFLTQNNEQHRKKRSRKGNWYLLVEGLDFVGKIAFKIGSWLFKLNQNIVV